MTAVLDALAAAPFDLDAYLAQFDPELLAEPEGRRILTRLDPLLFAVLYLAHHITMETDALDGDGLPQLGDLSLSEFHLDLIEEAKTWVVRNTRPAACRDAYVAPRESGKSTWIFTVLILWAAAHGHIKFVAAFADSAPQAEQHLATFKKELDENGLLRTDYPALCAPGKRPAGTNVSDNRTLMVARSGFVFSARGIDTSVLGLKIGTLRPDLIILDDIEKDEARYSAAGARKRLGTVLDAILPLNIRARVVLTGTVTMPNSIMHQLVTAARSTDPADTEDWITDSRFRVHYYAPILTNPDGSRRSLWPEKWPLEFLESIEHTRQYAKNYANDPMGADGEFWRLEDFTVADGGPPVHQVLWIDPAVKDKTTSDYTGLAVVSWSPRLRAHSVDDALHVKLAPARLRDRVLRILEDHPAIGVVIIETNQGGDTWLAILHDLPVPLETKHEHQAKVERAQRLLNHYQKRPTHVVHRRHFPDLVGEMVSFPRGINDDIVDAVGAAVEYNEARLKAARRPVGPPKARSSSWVG